MSLRNHNLWSARAKKPHNFSPNLCKRANLKIPKSSVSLEECRKTDAESWCFGAREVRCPNRVALPRAPFLAATRKSKVMVSPEACRKNLFFYSNAKSVFVVFKT